MTRKAHERARARSVARMQNPSAKYDAAGTGRRIASWNPPASGPNRAIEGLQKIRNRSRDAVRNDWAGENSTQKWTTNLVGTGIQPMFKNPEHRKVWDKFVKKADADDVLDFYGVQALAVRSWFDGGEVFERRRPRSLDTPLEVPLQVQLIEAEFCPLFDAVQWEGMPVGNTIRQGIERNKYGRRIAYWLYKEHPGDGVLGSAAMPSPTDLIRVPASEISHIFEPKRPGQLRGVSNLAPILARLRAMGDFEDAVLDRQKLANLFVMFVTRQMPQDWSDIDTDPSTGLPPWYDGEGRPMVGLEPGISQQLEPGEDVKFANPPEAGTSYPDYLRSTHLGTAAGSGLPYELFSGDIANVSDRTLRVILQEFRRFCQQRQYHVIIPMLCQRTVEWVADAAALAGLLPLSEIEEFKACEWSPHGWEYIHPVQDVQGKLMARDGGLVSTQQLISERGDDYRKVLDQREEWAAEEKKRDLVAPPPEPMGAPGAKPGAKPQPKAHEQIIVAQAPAAPNPLEAVLATVLANQQQSNNAVLQALAGIAQALADRPLHVAAPNVQVDNHAPAQPAPVVNVAAPDAPVVNVNVAAAEAPVVNVTNQIPEQAAPVVNVTNEVTPAVTVDVNLPERQTTSDITRDQRGDITKVIQTEKTVQH